jgi:hypothetical protein
MGNIMIKNGELVGTLDWEYAAYYPICDEYVSASLGLPEMDAEWKSLLRQHLDVHEDAKDFWIDLCHMRQCPDMDEKGQEILNKLSSN